jgi:DNA phosphorothioation-dependent restriction protein DptG
MCVEMVNFPNAVPLYFVIDGEKISLDKADIIEHKRYLDIKNGAIVRETIFKKGKKETGKVRKPFD